MPATRTDRIDGLTTSVAVKAPVRVATTAAITLSGLQTVDGVLVSDGDENTPPDRVLVKDQSDTTQNGLWDVSGSAWRRCRDFDGNRDVVQGTQVGVYEGTINGRTVWQCTTANPVSPGTSNIAFERIIDTDIADELVDTSNVNFGDALVGVKRTETGGIVRTQHQKNNDIVSKADFDSLVHALAAAGSGVVIEQDTGQLWLLGGVSPAFDENSSGVARCLAFDTGATLTVPASKQFDAIAWGDSGTDQIFHMAASSRAALINFNLTADATSVSSSNLYGVIGQITNFGAGSTKALYGRAHAGSGCTGTVMGGVFGVDTVTGLANATVLQLTPDTSTNGGKVNTYFWCSSNTASNVTADYGLLFDSKVSFTNSAFQTFAVGAGDFLTLKNAVGSIDLFRVTSTGKVLVNGDDLVLLSGKYVDFQNTVSSATAGGASALPATPSGYFQTKIGGVVKKVPYYD